MAWLLEAFLKRVVRRGVLEVECASGRQFTVGDGAGNPVAVRFVDHSAERQLMVNPALALGELFVEDRMLVTRGCIYDLLALVSSNLQWEDPQGIATTYAAVRKRLRPFRQRNSRPRAPNNVVHHYDVDGRFYDLFLDSDRQYSCA